MLADDLAYNQTFTTVQPLMNFWAAFTPSNEVSFLSISESPQIETLSRAVSVWVGNQRSETCFESVGQHDVQPYSIAHLLGFIATAQSSGRYTTLGRKSPILHAFLWAFNATTQSCSVRKYARYMFSPVETAF